MSAAYNIVPFQKDIFKRDFFLNQFVDGKDMVIVCVTYLNDRPIAATWCRRSKEMIHLALVIHTPVLSKYSPGKIHMMQLCDFLLNNKEIKVMDLTPLGYSWKEHFATTHDEVVSLVVCTSWLKKKQIELRNIIMDQGKVFLTKIGIEPSRFKAKIHKVFRSTTEFILTGEWKDPHPELRMYELKTNNLIPLPKETDILVTRNSINDLLSFKPINSDPCIGEFLSKASELFKKGAVSYSAAQNNNLVANGWILKDQIDLQLLQNKATIALPIKGSVFLNLYSHHEL
jgi:hypothetical protein